MDTESSEESDLYNPAPRHKIGREQFRKRNDRADLEPSEDESEEEDEEVSPRKQESKKKKPKKKREEKKSEFEDVLEKFKNTCSVTALRMTNLIASGLMMMSAVIRFGYLFDEFTIFFLFQNFYIISFIIIIVSAENGFGPSTGEKVRAYFNLLYNNFGRGIFICFTCMVLFERTDKNESLFALIAIIIGGINIVFGYNDSLKELPHKPWGETKPEDEEDGDLEKGVTKKEKLNKLKKKTEDKAARKKKYQLEDEPASSEGPPSSSSSSSDSVEINMSYEAPEGDFVDQGVRWEDQAKTGFSKKRRKKNQKKVASAREKLEMRQK